MPLDTDPRVADHDLATAPCALLARTHGAQLAGTAPVARGWVLLEQPGAWGRKALTSSGLEPALGAHLDEVAGDEVRVVLIRPPRGRIAPAAGPGSRTVVLAHVGPTPWLERLTLASDAELWELDPAVAASPTAPGLGEPLDEPLWLVCTHGKRDRCCAQHGRPIADALATQHPGQVWEVSHIGGHRFAGNVVSLPGGEVYGLLDVDTAVAAVAAQTDGRYDLGHLRGRSGWSRPEQAAEVLARLHLDVAAADAVTIIGSQPGPGEATTEVTVRIDGTDRRVTVRAEPTGVAYLQSCDKDEPADPGRFVLVDLSPVER